MNRELIVLLEYWEKEKGIEKSFLLNALESGLLTVYRKKAGLDENVNIKIDPETGDLKFLNAKGEEIPPPNFPWERIAAQTAKHVIMQRLREAEKSTVYNEFKKLEGSLISGRVERFEENNIVVSIGKTEGLLPHLHKLENERFRTGNPIKAYIIEVRKPNRGMYQVILSRTHPNFVKELLENEIPEIKDGTIKIKSIARFPGDIVKAAVFSTDEKVDAVGTCVGEKARRIKNIMKELNGEKVEIILWDKDIGRYIMNSLSPASGKRVIVDDKKKEAVVIVDDGQLFLAIGKRGQNVRLASKLTGWNIRVLRESEYKSDEKPAVGIIDGIDEKTALELAKFGYSSIKSLAEADVDEIKKIPAIGDNLAREIVDRAKNYREKKKEETRGSEIPEGQDKGGEKEEIGE
ncbi:MAG: transcription termination factor NusA [Candidatus Omnitrophica bacterium]|nr:transcription termination factor NusA [Candidatus Omnitrophota bacterium]